MSAPTFTHLIGSGSGADANNYVTASFTVTSGKPVIFAVHNQISAGTATLPTLSSVPVGVTAQQIDPAGTPDGTDTLTQRRLTLFWLTGTGTGTVTIDFGGVTQLGCGWWGDEVTNGSLSLPSNMNEANGSSVGPNANLTSVTSGNSVFAACAVGAQTTHTADSGWTLTATRFNQSSPNMSTSAIYRTNHDDATPSLALGVSADWIMIAIEIAALAAPSLRGWGVIKG